MRRLEKDIQLKYDKAVEIASRAASRKSRPEDKARVYVAEMKKKGFNLDVKDVVKFFKMQTER